MLGGLTAALLCACGLLSGVDDLHLSNAGDGSIGVVVDGGPPVKVPVADAESPPNDAETPVEDAGEGDAVVGGNLLTSPNYSLMLSVGEAPGGNGVSLSSHYRFVGGVVGTTQQ
jgi:hypothetical protein